MPASTPSIADAAAEDALEERLFDGSADALPDDDVEPPAAIDDPALERLITQAEHLAGQSGDPKLKLLIDHVGQLTVDGFSPVVFCRYIATAHYLGRHLQGRLPDVTIGVVTGELTSDERRERVDTLGEAERRLLIATDCLSEGVNLQEHFDAVVHYDLSWNPTRHEQREGRVDRFGQNGPNKDEDGRSIVRATLIYGANNPVDGAVLEVILRKAEKIREELGVAVPFPDEGHTLTQALMRAVLLRRKNGGMQQVLDFGGIPEARAIDSSWKDAAEKAKRSRTVFAQRRLKPEDVLPEWHKTLAAIGGADDVRRFTDRALARLGSGLEPLRRGFKAPLSPLPEDVRERLEAEGLAGTLFIDFVYPSAPRCRPVHRSHPLVSVLADTLLERTLAADVDDADRDPGVLGRVGCWVSSAVSERTVVALMRLRHQLVSQKAGSPRRCSSKRQRRSRGAQHERLRPSRALMRSRFLRRLRSRIRRRTSASVPSGTRSNSSRPGSMISMRSPSGAPRRCWRTIDAFGRRRTRAAAIASRRSCHQTSSVSSCCSRTWTDRHGTRSQSSPA